MSWFRMFQPLKYDVNINVFIRFHFFMFFMNLMLPGTSLELIWRSLEVSRQHFDDF